MVEEINFPHLNYIMEEMCDKVGANWDEIDQKEEGWYEKHSWSYKEYLDFKDWFIDYLYKNSDARNEILISGKKNISKKLLKKVVEEFLFNYGWKFEDE